MCSVLNKGRMSNSSSPCAACKLRRQKCAQECIFAPYFPPDQPQKFANVHEVFGASNVGKILNELSPVHREDAVNSLAYEAEARLRNPVYGCVGLISILQQKLKEVQHDLFNAKNELAKYIGPSAMLPIFNPGLIQQANPDSGGLSYNMQSMLGLPVQQNQLMIREPQQQQMMEAQQLAAAVAAREQQEIMIRAYEQQQQPEIVRYNGGFEGFDHTNGGEISSPFLALGSYDNTISYQIEQQQPKDEQQLLPQQFLFQQQPGLQRAGSEEGTSGMRPQL